MLKQEFWLLSNTMDCPAFKADIKNVANKVPGYLPDFRGILWTMYVNDRYRKQRKLG